MVLPRLFGALLFASVLASFVRPATAEGVSNLFEATFGAAASPPINKVVILGLNPWINRILTATTGSFDAGRSSTDSEAMLRDHAGILGLEDALRSTNVLGPGCYQTSYTPRNFPFSWVVVFHDDESAITGKGSDDRIVGEVFLSKDGLCASTGKQLYNIDPQGFAMYLRRTFSFMNF